MASIFILSKLFTSLYILDMIEKLLGWAVLPFGLSLCFFSCTFLDVISVMRLHTTINMVIERLYL